MPKKGWVEKAAETGDWGEAERDARKALDRANRKLLAEEYPDDELGDAKPKESPAGFTPPLLRVRGAIAVGLGGGRKKLLLQNLQPHLRGRIGEAMRKREDFCRRDAEALRKRIKRIEEWERNPARVAEALKAQRRERELRERLGDEAFEEFKRNGYQFSKNGDWASPSKPLRGPQDPPPHPSAPVPSAREHESYKFRSVASALRESDGKHRRFGPPPKIGDQRSHPYYGWKPGKVGRPKKEGALTNAERARRHRAKRKRI